jgi:hypothetical protein
MLQTIAFSLTCATVISTIILGCICGRRVRHIAHWIETQHADYWNQLPWTYRFSPILREIVVMRFAETHAIADPRINSLYQNLHTLRRSYWIAFACSVTGCLLFLYFTRVH